MNHLVIYAHPERGSFSDALKERIASTLGRLGHAVTVRDLYSLQFQPVLVVDDLERFRRGEIPDDVRAEQEHVAAADVLHYVYPLWWTGVPALLKGYIDRTFTPGFAYRRVAGGIARLLEGKSALLWTPHGNTREDYEAGGRYDALRMTMDVGVFEFVGNRVLKHTYFPDIRASEEPTRRLWLTGVEDELVARFGERETVAIS